MTKLTLNGLYAITDRALLQHNFSEAIEQSLLGGSRIIQYRDKSTDNSRRLEEARIIRQLCDRYQAIFIVNDDIELARQTDADGVHLGKDDQDIEQARQQLGDEKIIGVSCYNRLDLAINAEQAGADYVAFGAMFNSSIKPEAVIAPLSLIAEARSRLQIPICCIGGINADNAAQLIAEGADMIAVISEIFAAEQRQQTVQQASKRLSQLFTHESSVKIL